MSPIRELNAIEYRDIADRMMAAWEVTQPYWYPLNSVARTDVLAFQEPHFRRALCGGPIQAILRSRNIDRVWELREWGESFEVSVDEVDPEYTGAEGFWCSDSLDWILYASHESSITVGGHWLIDAVEREWPDWENHVWTSPFFE